MGLDELDLIGAELVVTTARDGDDRREPSAFVSRETADELTPLGVAWDVGTEPLEAIAL